MCGYCCFRTTGGKGLKLRTLQLGSKWADFLHSFEGLFCYPRVANQPLDLHFLLQACKANAVTAAFRREAPAHYSMICAGDDRRRVGCRATVCIRTSLEFGRWSQISTLAQEIQDTSKPCLPISRKRSSDEVPLKMPHPL